ncbi:MAG: hypothetical protein M5U31_15700 [Acidimicrobiia bacterium]|nr:hypothetical protein [Acidimicrobiia bacterium]
MVQEPGEDRAPLASAPPVTLPVTHHIDATEARARRGRVAVFAAPMALLTVMGWVGDALAPTLLASAPLVLIALNPRMRNLALVSPSVSVVPFFTVAMLRQVAGDPLFFWFGRRYGDAAVRWMERRMGPAAKPVLLLERLFARAAHPVTAIAPNNLVCILGGATGMGWLAFLALNLGGTAVRIAAIRAVGDALSEPIFDITDWISDHRTGLTLLSVSLVGLLVWRSFRTGRGELATPDLLEEELECAADE